jgi:hypothetical protein
MVTDPSVLILNSAPTYGSYEMLYLSVLGKLFLKINAFPFLIPAAKKEKRYCSFKKKERVTVSFKFFLKSKMLLMMYFLRTIFKQKITD